MTEPHLDKRFDSARVAQQALASQDGSYGDFMHIKPANSQGATNSRSRSIKVNVMYFIFR